MLSPKRATIEGASGAFSDSERDLWLPLLTGSAIYRRTFPNFEDVESKLLSVEVDSLQAKQLNATMVLLDRIGPVAASTTGQDGTYSTVENREGLLEYAFAVLYGAEFWSMLISGWSRPVSYGVKNRAIIR